MHDLVKNFYSKDIYIFLRYQIYEKKSEKYVSTTKEMFNVYCFYMQMDEYIFPFFLEAEKRKMDTQ